MQVVVETLQCNTSIDQALVTFCQKPGFVLLESSMFDSTYARYSILAFDPVDRLRVSHAADLVDSIRSRVGNTAPSKACHGRLPFVGGWIGWIGYEAGAALAGITSRHSPDLPLPAAELRFYDTAALYDHSHGLWHLAALAYPAEPSRQTPADRLRALADELNNAAHRDVTPIEAIEAFDLEIPPLCPRYRDSFIRAMRYIEDGDIYQVNLTRRFRSASAQAPEHVYRRLRRHCPSPFGAYLAFDHYALISSSPELFLHSDGNRVFTRPIKGTRQRGTDFADDEVARRQLARSAKDRAELNMIVDLLRNDLGRVCQYGSVRVVCDGAIETHPNVFHRVATIEGRLAADADYLDLLAATLPGGSVTGAPKIRAMQIIDELESTRRDAYCGCIGYIGLDGKLCMNIAIRTMIHSAGHLYWYAGGAVVADSKVKSEWHELHAKASAMTAVTTGHRFADQREAAVIQAC